MLKRFLAHAAKRVGAGPAISTRRAAMCAHHFLDAVVADADYGTTTGFRTGLERMGLRYAVGVRSVLYAWAPGASTSCRLDTKGRALPRPAWRRVTWGQRTKGPLAARFVARLVRLRHRRGERWVLFERSLADDTRKYYLLNLEPTASLTQLVRLARSRWPIKQQYRELKTNWGWTTSRGTPTPGGLTTPRSPQPHPSAIGTVSLGRCAGTHAARPASVDEGNRRASVLCGQPSTLQPAGQLSAQPAPTKMTE